MINNDELVLFAYLRQNSRISLTDLSRKTGVAVSTLFDRLRDSRRDNVITKHTVLFDFQKINYNARASMLLSVEREDKQKLSDYLQLHNNINTVYKINNGFDFLVECVFTTVCELEQFSDLLDEKFRIKNKEVHYIVNDVKREGFLADPSFVDWVKKGVASTI